MLSASREENLKISTCGIEILRTVSSWIRIGDQAWFNLVRTCADSADEIATVNANGIIACRVPQSHPIGNSNTVHGTDARYHMTRLARLFNTGTPDLPDGKMKHDLL